jgi:hypothetical protein
VKDHFAKLKFNFIELETKQLFYEFVSTENLDDSVPDEAGATNEAKKSWLNVSL